jgi:hypothetical protein
MALDQQTGITNAGRTRGRQKRMAFICSRFCPFIPKGYIYIYIYIYICRYQQKEETSCGLADSCKKRDPSPSAARCAVRMSPPP